MLCLWEQQELESILACGLFKTKNEMTIPFSLSELVAVQKHNELKVLLK